MKFILSFLLMVFGLSASAQTVTLLTLSTNKVPPVQTNTTASSSIPVLAAANKVSLFFRGTGVAWTNAATPGGGTITLVFDVSINDSMYYKDARFRFPLTLNDTTEVTGWTNIGCQGYQYLRLSSIENPTTNGCLSNIVIHALVK
jgi:hypothetical protein